MAKPQPITSLPPSPDDDRKRRMLLYSLTMGVRLVCILSLLFVRGWWMAVPALGAIVLPYFAVVLANAVDSRMARPASPVSPVLPTARGIVQARAVLPVPAHPVSPEQPEQPEHAGPVDADADARDEGAAG